MENSRFIVVELCDNDFGCDLKNALSDLIDESGEIGFCPIVAKRYLIEHIVSQNSLRSILRQEGFDADHLRKYLNKIRVTFRDSLPTYQPFSKDVVDHDNGSAYYDSRLKKVILF